MHEHAQDEQQGRQGAAEQANYNRGVAGVLRFQGQCDITCNLRTTYVHVVVSRQGGQPHSATIALGPRPFDRLSEHVTLWCSWLPATMMIVRKAQHVQWSSCYWPKVPQQQAAAKQGCQGGSAVRTCCCCTSFFQTDLGGGGRLCSLVTRVDPCDVATAATSKGSAQLAGSFFASLNVPTTCCHKGTSCLHTCRLCC